MKAAVRGENTKQLSGTTIGLSSISLSTDDLPPKSLCR